MKNFKSVSLVIASQKTSSSVTVPSQLGRTYTNRKSGVHIPNTFFAISPLRVRYLDFSTIGILTLIYGPFRAPKQFYDSNKCNIYKKNMFMYCVYYQKVTG